MKQRSGNRFVALDGLRGWGALAVVLYHVFVEIFPASPQSAAELKRLFIFNGPLAVMVFFVVSGYSLSVGFLQSRNRETLARILIGRYFRLAVPILLACLLMWISVSAGIIHEQIYRENAASLSRVMRFALFDTFVPHNPMKSPLPPLWTMPVEMGGSLMIIGGLLLTGATRWRFAVYAVAASVALWAFPLTVAFLAGALLAEIREDAISERVADAVSVIATAMIVPSLIGAAFLPPVLVSHAHLYAGTATLISFALLCSRPAQRFLASPLSRVLGGISFPLYLLHAMVIYSLGTWLMKHVTGAEWIIAADMMVVVACVACARLLRSIDTIGIAISKRVADAVMRSAAIAAMRMSAAPASAMSGRQ